MRVYKNEDGRMVLDFEGETLWMDQKIENIGDLMACDTVIANADFKSTKERKEKIEMVEHLDLAAVRADLNNILAMTDKFMRCMDIESAKEPVMTLEQLVFYELYKDADWCSGVLQKLIVIINEEIKKR